MMYISQVKYHAVTNEIMVDGKVVQPAKKYWESVADEQKLSRAKKLAQLLPKEYDYLQTNEWKPMSWDDQIKREKIRQKKFYDSQIDNAMIEDSDDEKSGSASRRRKKTKVKITYTPGTTVDLCSEPDEPTDNRAPASSTLMSPSQYPLILHQSSKTQHNPFHKEFKGKHKKKKKTRGSRACM